MSMTRDDKIKCDECGKFIGVQDLMDGKALHHCTLPDSEFSDETFESLCSKCFSPPVPSEKCPVCNGAKVIYDCENGCDECRRPCYECSALPSEKCPVCNGAKVIYDCENGCDECRRPCYECSALPSDQRGGAA